MMTKQRLGLVSLIGVLALGIIPSWPQVIGMLIVLVGFRFTLR